jgi:hypothetical protein
VKGAFNHGTWVRFAVAATGETINAKITNVSLVKYGKGFVFDLDNSAPSLERNLLDH